MAAIAGAVLGGCAGSPDTLFGGEAAAEAERATGAVAIAPEIYPLKVGRVRWLDQRGVEHVRDASMDKELGRWVITMLEPSASGGPLKPARRLTLSTTEGGAVVLHRLEESAEDLVIEFEPPLMMCPPSLPVGQRWQSSAVGRVVDSKGRQKAGEVPATQELLVGSVDPESVAREIRSRLTIEADPAVVRRTSIITDRPGVGAIREREKLEVRVAGIRIKNRDRTLSPAPTGAGGAN